MFSASGREDQELSLPNMYDFVVFLDVDWESTDQKNRQHFLIAEMARQLEGRSKILGVERPVCPWTDPFCKREKYIQWLQGERGLRQAGANLHIYTPFVLVHNLVAARIPRITALNRRLLRLLLRRVLQKLDFRTDNLIAWIHHPYQLEDVGLVKEQFLVYDCYDDYIASERNPARRHDLVKREQTILKRADIVLVASEELLATKGKVREDIHLVSNAVDGQNFALARVQETETAENIADFPKPILGYVGTINERTDFQLVVDTARRRPHWSLVFVGPYVPQNKGFFSTKPFQEAKALLNVHFLEGVPYERLPHYLKAFDVCMIPYAMNEFNSSCSPLKIYEYLATGKPIVTTDLPGVRIFREVIRIAADHNSFVDQIEEALRENNIELIKRRLAIAQLNSWDARAEMIINIIDAQLRK